MASLIACAASPLTEALKRKWDLGQPFNLHLFWKVKSNDALKQSTTWSSDSVIKHQTARSDVLNKFLCDCCRSAPEHNVVVMPEREKEPDWKSGDRNISGTRNRNRCCNGSKSEAPKPGQNTESPLKQNGGPAVTLLTSFINSALFTALVSLALLMSSRCVSRSYSTEVRHRAAWRWSVRVWFGLRQLVRQREGQQGELGQLEQRQQHGGRQRRQRPNTCLHYLI